MPESLDFCTRSGAGTSAACGTERRDFGDSKSQFSRGTDELELRLWQVRNMAAGNPYTKQHTTARTYLKSWAVPPIVKGREKCWAFLMTAQCECAPGGLRPLTEIMWEPDIYTLYAADGSRDVRYEAKIFERAERQYSELKQIFNRPNKLLELSYRRRLARFTAYQLMKTPAMFQSYLGQITEVISAYDSVEWPRPELISFELLNRQGKMVPHTVDEARPLVDGVFENFILPRLDHVVSVVKSMKLRLVCFSGPNVLITSDTPAIMRVLYSGAYFATISDQNTQISMPLSPNLLAIFNWHTDGVETGDAAAAMEANILRVRNARRMLVNSSDRIDRAIFNAAQSAPEASQFQGFRGHLDPVPPEIRKASPMLFEASGPNVGPIRFAMLPDGTIVSQPLPGVSPPGKSPPGQ